MIDKDDIIGNNVLERYVLGELSDSQQKEIEHAIYNSAALKAQLDIIESDFEKLARENTIEAPVEIKRNLLMITSTDNSLKKHRPKQSKARFLFWIAASFAIFLLLGNIYLYSQRQDTLENLKIAEQEKLKLNEKLHRVNDSLKTINSQYALIENPKTETYTLTGNKLKPNAEVIAYINDAEKKVLVDAKNLTQLDKAHDYQMWADVNGKMIDMGLLDTNQDLVVMNYIEGAKSINVTIEPAGGSDHATVANLVGNVYLD